MCECVCGKERQRGRDTHSKKTCISTKQPYMTAKETCISTQEPSTLSLSLADTHMSVCVVERDREEERNRERQREREKQRETDRKRYKESWGCGIGSCGGLK